jgi:hypothetical protein
MKKPFISLIIFLSCITALSAKESLLNAKNLLTYLPKTEVKDLIRIEQEIPGTAKDMTSAMVQYMRMPSEANPHILSAAISIIDGINYQNSIGSQIKDKSPGDEPFTVKGKYKGIRNNKITSIGNEKNCRIEFIIENRFYITVFVSGNDDLKFAETFIDLINLKGLEAATKEK